MSPVSRPRSNATPTRRRRRAHPRSCESRPAQLEDDLRRRCAARGARRRVACRCSGGRLQRPAPSGDEGGPAGSGRLPTMTRRRSGRMPCGRNQRKRMISRPMATHCSAGIRPGAADRRDVAGGLLEAHRHEDRAEDRALVVAQPADDHGGEEHDRLGVAPGRRVPQVDEADEHPAAQAGDGAAEDEHGRAQRRQVLAERVGDDVVVAHRPQRAAVGRLGDPADEAGTRYGEHDRDDAVAPLVVGTTAGRTCSRSGAGTSDSPAAPLRNGR